MTFEDGSHGNLNKLSVAILTILTPFSYDVKWAYKISSKPDHFVVVVSIFKISPTTVVFTNVTHLKRSISVCKQIFDKTFQSVDVISLLSISENKRPPHWNSTSGFYFGRLSLSACHCTAACEISSDLDHRRWIYELTTSLSICQDGGQSVANQLCVLDLKTLHILEFKVHFLT